MNLIEMERNLAMLKDAPILSAESRESAKHAVDFLRAFRANRQMDWGTSADCLYSVAVNLPGSPE